MCTKQVLVTVLKDIKDNYLYSLIELKIGIVVVFEKINLLNNISIGTILMNRYREFIF